MLCLPSTNLLLLMNMMSHLTTSVHFLVNNHKNRQIQAYVAYGGMPGRCSGLTLWPPRVTRIKFLLTIIITPESHSKVKRIKEMITS